MDSSVFSKWPKIAELSPENLATLREAYIQKNASKYLPIMAKIDSGSTVRGSLVAFFFGIFWLVYRKLYRNTGALLYAAFIIICIFFGASGYDGILNPLCFGANVVFAIMARKLYWQTTCQEISNALSATDNDIEKAKTILLNRGGVNVAAVLITLAAIVIFIFCVGLTV